MAFNKLGVTSVAARKTALHISNKIFHPSEIKRPKYQNFCLIGNPEPPNLEHIEEVYKRDYEAVQDSPLVDIIPSVHAPVACLNCKSPVAWHNFHASTIVVELCHRMTLTICQHCRAGGNSK